MSLIDMLEVLQHIPASVVQCDKVALESSYGGSGVGALLVAQNEEVFASQIVKHELKLIRSGKGRTVARLVSKDGMVRSHRVESKVDVSQEVEHCEDTQRSNIVLVLDELISHELSDTSGVYWR
jgi:hypothetical protein